MQNSLSRRGTATFADRLGQVAGKPSQTHTGSLRPTLRSEGGDGEKKILCQRAPILCELSTPPELWCHTTYSHPTKTTSSPVRRKLPEKSGPKQHSTLRIDVVWNRQSPSAERTSTLNLQQTQCTPFKNAQTLLRLCFPNKNRELRTAKGKVKAGIIERQ
jgi:hypothetical protein